MKIGEAHMNRLVSVCTWLQRQGERGRCFAATVGWLSSQMLEVSCMPHESDDEHAAAREVRRTGRSGRQ